MWFPRLASDRVLRARPMDGPFVLTLHERNADRIYCLNAAAQQAGLERGMGYSDARAFCPDLTSQPANTKADGRFQRMLARWAGRYCPWVGLEGRDGLVMDISGTPHLFGGETPMLDDMNARLARAGLQVQMGLGDTRGAAWALARYGTDARANVAAAGRPMDRLGGLPVTALRLEDKANTALLRLGVRTISDLADLPRATITRRFGPHVLMRLAQALGDQPEHLSPLPDPPQFSVRMTLPDPIGLAGDVMAGTARLLDRLCDKLKDHEQGARVLRLDLRRVDQASQQVELRLARPLRDPHRILPLFQRGVDGIDAGFGIDQIRLEAVQVEALPVQQVSHVAYAQAGPDMGDTTGLEDLITKVGNRIGLDNVQRFLPADSHIPERSHIIAQAAYSSPAPSWPVMRHRPLRLFAPEHVAATGRTPPGRFRWRRMALQTARATGPERLAPEWWMADDAWRSGVRDYWKVETQQGRRLWMYHTPQSPGWFVQGEFA
ncbi:DNA polymerase Y family protein [Aestuariibius sp. HNIBRBA575]|uniref:Y-family DNA polymerase n=1 Tax=Aestuariibius sp. HNIBRBA575 TaxID=3233343 RepID=UPI0034A2CFAF